MKRYFRDMRPDCTLARLTRNWDEIHYTKWACDGNTKEKRKGAGLMRDSRWPHFVGRVATASLFVCMCPTGTLLKETAKLDKFRCYKVNCWKEWKPGKVEQKAEKCLWRNLHGTLSWMAIILIIAGRLINAFFSYPYGYFHCLCFVFSIAAPVGHEMKTKTLFWLVIICQPNETVHCCSVEMQRQSTNEVRL